MTSEGSSTYKRFLVLSGIFLLTLCAATFLSTRSVSAGYADMPRTLPGAPSGLQFINLADGPPPDDDNPGGGGANVQESFIKVYSPDAGGKQIDFGVVVRSIPPEKSCYDYHIGWIYHRLTPGGAIIQSIPGNDILITDCTIGPGKSNIPYTLYFGPNLLTQQTGVDGQQDLFAGIVELKLKNYPNNFNTRKSATLRVDVNAAYEARLGYAGGFPVTLYPSLNAATHTMSLKFRAPCYNTLNPKRFYFFDDDRASSKQQNIPIYGNLFQYNPYVSFTNRTGPIASVPDRERTNSANPTADPFDGFGGSGWGRLTFNTQPGTSYELEMSNVKGANGIQFIMPYDSGDFYIPCPNWALTPSSSVSPDYVEQGKTITYGHSVYNSGDTTAFNFGNFPEYNYDPANVPAGPGAWRAGPVNWASTIAAKGTLSDPKSQLFPDNTPLGLAFCQRYGVSRQAYNNPNPAWSAAVCARTVGGKTYPSASNSINDAEPGEALTMEARLITDSYTGWGAWPGYTAHCNYTLTTNIYGGGSPSSSGDCSKSITANGSVSVAMNPNTNLPIGSRICLVVNLYGATGSFGSNNNLLKFGPMVSEPVCTNIVAKPYLRAYSSDVAVGQGFGAEPCNSSSSIIGWNRGVSNKYAGAGVQFAAFAQSQIRYFAAGQGVEVTPAYGYAPNRLAFSNASSVTNIPNGIYGGGFNGNSCGMTDYYASRSDASPNWTNMTDANGAGDRIYNSPGNLILPGGTVNNSSKIKLYVNGDVYISGNIDAQLGAQSAEEVPNFTLIAKGNIYLSPGVNRLYGTYVAQPNGPSGGNIYTCAKSSPAFAPYNPMNSNGANSDYATCNSKLVVIGSFVAKKVNLLRTHGSQIFDNGDSRVPNSGTLAGAGYTNAAEVFIYNHLIWLEQSGSIDDSTARTYDAITTLPPVL